MTQPFYVFGMFRSGTTLLARMLDTHRNIVCASDPFRPFYNALRDDVAEDEQIPLEPYAPLGDYFADEQQLDLYQAIQAATLDRPFERDGGELLDRIISHSTPFSPRIADVLSEEHLGEDTFGSIHQRLIAEVPEQYGDGDESLIGTKEVWTTEFVPTLHATDPESKFLLVVRDPRAVCASKFKREETYPWLFLARQWRKLTLLSHHYANNVFPENAHLITYEDLVTRPEHTAKEMCSFLGVELDDRILNPGNFTDGEGNPWIQNTSYEGEEPSFNTDSVRKWENVLEPSIVEFIERLCFSEMSLMDYRRTSATELGFTDAEMTDPPRIPTAELANWIVPYYGNKTALERTEDMAQEEVRHRLLRLPEEKFRELPEHLVQDYFLEEEIALDCRKQIRRHR